MIEFKPFTLEDKALYEQYLEDGKEYNCEYSFTNLFLWGRQKFALIHDHVALFSQFDRRSVYPYPVGSADKKKVLDAMIADAQSRGIPCRITGLSAEEKENLAKLYPGRFRFHCDRSSYDYVYDINDLADLKGRKYHGKRNHCYRFRDAYPSCTVQPLTDDNLPLVKQMLDQWYVSRLQMAPDNDFHMEQAALTKALNNYRALGLEGLVLMDGEQVLAFTLGSQLSADTFDVHFEKACHGMDGAYAVINYEFARYIREKYPMVRFLNREDDMGLEGLRKAKESYHPHHMIEKCWACLLEEGYEY